MARTESVLEDYDWGDDDWGDEPWCACAECVCGRADDFDEAGVCRHCQAGDHEPDE